jgi:hypothetical protein
VRDDHRQGIVMFRPRVNEVNVEAVDPGNEHGQRVQRLLAFAPVVIGLPVVHELLHCLQPHALSTR